MKLKTLMFAVINFLWLSFDTLRKAMMEILIRMFGCAFLIIGIFVFAFSIVIGTIDLVYFYISRNYFNRKQQKNNNCWLSDFGKYVDQNKWGSPL